MEDAPGTNPHYALAHFTNWARAATTFARQLTAAGIGDGGAAWTPFLSDYQNLPPRFATAVKARCGMTRDIGDPRIRLLSR